MKFLLFIIKILSPKRCFLLVFLTLGLSSTVRGQLIFMPKAININDISGKKFGMLTITGIVGIAKWGTKISALCDCGNTTELYYNNIQSGHTKSCGCLQKETRTAQKKHGLSSHPLFRVWAGILARCYNPNRKSYKFYGAKGITVCDQWKNDFKSFYDWAIANGYQKGLEIDRINFLSGYSPENCRWATRKEQQRNTSTNTFYEFNGESKTLAEWCEILDLDYKLTHQRMKRDGRSLSYLFNNKDISYKRDRCKLTEQQVIEIYLSVEPNFMLAKKFNVKPGTIHSIKQNKNWTHVTQNL